MCVKACIPSQYTSCLYETVYLFVIQSFFHCSRRHNNNALHCITYLHCKSNTYIQFNYNGLVPQVPKNTIRKNINIFIFSGQTHVSAALLSCVFNFVHDIMGQAQEKMKWIVSFTIYALHVLVVEGMHNIFTFFHMIMMIHPLLFLCPAIFCVCSDGTGGDFFILGQI